MTAAACPSRPFLLDVSRLIWRAWAGRLPTGIDRVCLAYLDRFAARSQAVIQRGRRRLILGPAQSDRLFRLLREGPTGRRLEFARILAGALIGARSSAPRPGLFYLNVGHTGLDEPTLPAWIAKNELRAIYLIHDLIPLTHPEYCRAGEATRHARRMSNALKSAHGIIGNSEATIDDLASFASERGQSMPPNVVALLSGADPLPVTPKAAERPYFVTLGTIEGRKNHLLLLQLWQRLIGELGDDAPMLVIIGQRGWEAAPALSMLDRLPELRRHVLELGSCGDQELAQWIAGSRALLMPSFTEGFGLPIIEALQLGAPVIATDLPVYREIAGEIPTYLDPLDGPAWLQSIRDFVSDGPERSRQLAAIPGYRAPDWDRHFTTVEDWLETL